MKEPIKMRKIEKIFFPEVKSLDKPVLMDLTGNARLSWSLVMLVVLA